ncbi:MAG TPA: DUF2778 domain-containing protein [Candidatus Competibacter phosphatis]|nr:DUF2778 domain-containing protein [Candidatus Competibacter phosphatis]
MGDYSSERYNPTFPHCGQLRLFFEGAHLRMSGGSQTYSYPAVSGRPVNGRFDYSASRQRVSGEGPIPQGIYWIRPDELDDNWINCQLSGRFANAWGRYRISIHPFTTTETFGRGGFFIHGGATPGSAGCIDLTNHMDRFVADLRREVGASAQTCQIHLEVLYPLPSGDYPTPGDTRVV